MCGGGNLCSQVRCVILHNPVKFPCLHNFLTVPLGWHYNHNRKHEHILAATTGGDWKTTGLIGINFSVLLDSGKKAMCLLIVSLL